MYKYIYIWKIFYVMNVLSATGIRMSYDNNLVYDASEVCRGQLFSLE